MRMEKRVRQHLPWRLREAIDLGEMVMSEAVVEIQNNFRTEGTAADMPGIREYKVNNKKSYLVIKRLFDVVMALVGGILCLIPMLLTAVLIRIESPGPAIYAQERLGKDGKPFVMYKFRSMYLNSEKDGPKWASRNDCRCTKVGRIIRKFHIDELPQLWNVLKGDMSVVGPRPERAFFYEVFSETVPDFYERLRVAPGLTCIAQISGGYVLLPEEKLAYDVEYMETRSVAVDLMCILKTIPAIFKHEGAW